jgi:DNA-binding NtrC family response regulator
MAARARRHKVARRGELSRSPLPLGPKLLVPSTMKSRWHILVVADADAMTESLAACLREGGYSVDTAASGREAIERARAREYAIHFVDLDMPGGLDGIETTMEIRKLRKDASVVTFTAHATIDTAIAAMKESAQEYVVKPCHPQEISLLVERIIRVKNIERENAILRRKLSRHDRNHRLESLKRQAAGTEPAEAASFPPGLTLQEMEKRYLAATLARLSGNVKAAAESLGIDRSTLYEKIKRYEIPR